MTWVTFKTTNSIEYAVQFLEDLGNNIKSERSSKSYLFQSIGMAI